MTSQSTKKVGGGSPTNPDSTCQTGDEMNQIEARIQAMEERLLKDQETKFKTLLATINASKATGADNHTSTNQVGLEAGMKDLKEKIEHLVSGENEANKMIDELKRTDSLATQLDNNEERADKFRQVVFDQLKDLNEESKHNKKYLKDIERELDHLRHDIKDLKEIERKNTDLLRSNNKKLDIVERQTRTAKRRRSTRSRSGSSRSGSRRRSRSSSTSRSRRKSSRSKRNVNSRDSSVSAAIQMKSNDFEKLLVQINDSIGVLGEKVEKNEVIDLVKETLVPQVLSIKESLVPHVLSIKETLDRSGSLLTFPAPKVRQGSIL